MNGSIPPPQPASSSSIWGNPSNLAGADSAAANASPWGGGIANANSNSNSNEEDYSWVAESIFKKSPNLSESRVVDWIKNNPSSSSGDQPQSSNDPNIVEDMSPKEVARRSIMTRKNTADSESDATSVKSSTSAGVRSPHQSPSGRKSRSLSGGRHGSKSPKPSNLTNVVSEGLRERTDSSGRSPNVDIGARMLKVVQQKYESGEIDQEEKEVRERERSVEDVIACRVFDVL